MGFCSSYLKVTRFERNAAAFLNVDLDVSLDSVVQHIADNADHNTCTLDGNGTLHGMAIIATVTPQLLRKRKAIPRNNVTSPFYISFSNLSLLNLITDTLSVLGY